MKLIAFTQFMEIVQTILVRQLYGVMKYLLIQ
ncbi:hypothetical protein BAMTA208_06850 [Bacillus amyloliquefaciens TA208]|nr:hypothetical protein BAMTA208_06850 [Bacillus amyloliquefaciens TA208]